MWDSMDSMWIGYKSNRNWPSDRPTNSPYTPTPPSALYTAFHDPRLSSAPSLDSTRASNTSPPFTALTPCGVPVRIRSPGCTGKRSLMYCRSGSTWGR